MIDRFLSPDPIGFAGGDVNLYRYVKNNPLRYVDPFGLYDLPSSYSTITGAYGEPRASGPHGGVDYRNPVGGAVYATESGVVATVYSNSRGGNQIVLSLDTGAAAGYAHTFPIVEPGQSVNEGQVIGFSDRSGNVAPHTHYTYREGLFSGSENPLYQQIFSPSNSCGGGR